MISNTYHHHDVWGNQGTSLAIKRLLSIVVVYNVQYLLSLSTTGTSIMKTCHKTAVHTFKTCLCNFTWCIVLNFRRLVFVKLKISLRTIYSILTEVNSRHVARIVSFSIYPIYHQCQLTLNIYRQSSRLIQLFMVWLFLFVLNMTYLSLIDNKLTINLLFAIPTKKRFVRA